MHSGFSNLRSALPVNLPARHLGFRVRAGAQADIDRVTVLRRECLDRYGGPFLFGDPTRADAMYAPVCPRFIAYDAALDSACAAYRDTGLAMRHAQARIDVIRTEPDEVEELDAER
ncbi:MAG: hypothetical protein U1F52_14385 [Burkholderiales bacterium]